MGNALLQAVAAADPTGTQAMAAASTDNGEGGLLAVDATRLGAVATWDPAWVGSIRGDIGGALHPPQSTAPLLVRGHLSVQATFTRTLGDTPLALVLHARASSGIPVQVPMGELTFGTATSAESPKLRLKVSALRASWW